MNLSSKTNGQRSESKGYYQVPHPKHLSIIKAKLVYSRVAQLVNLHELLIMARFFSICKSMDLRQSNSEMSINLETIRYTLYIENLHRKSLLLKNIQ